MKKIVFLLSLFMPMYSLAAEISAPFGFEWGKTKLDIESTGIKLTECQEETGVTTCQTTIPPKGISFGETYFLFIDRDKGLQKLILIGKTIESDITGSEGKAIYEKIKSGLSDKYGKPESYEYSGRKLYDEYDEFYQCLKYDGCGSWFSFWSPAEGGSSSLELNGLKRGAGFLRLAYESKEWESIINSIENRKLSEDNDAL